MRPKGFTQVELLLALALLALFATLGFDAVRSTVRRLAHQGGDDRRAHALDTVLTVLARDVRGAYLASDNTSSVFTAHVDGEFSRMDFERAPRAPDDAGDEIGFAVKRDARTGRWELYRRTQSPADADRLQGGRDAYLCEVSAFSLQFFDGESWRSHWGWDASRGQPTVGIRGLPLMVSVKISAQVDGQVVDADRVIPVMVPVLNRSLGA